MIEKLIHLEGIDPVNIYGVNNTKYEKITGYFPKLKIIARGNELKVMGDTEEITQFEKKIELLIAYYQKFGNLSISDIQELMVEEGERWLESNENTSDALLFGNSGKPIRARTVNQKKLVKDFEINDLLFAIGPAGSGKTYTAIALAVKALKNRQVKRIILTRPAVEAGENLGFLPGDYKAKLDPYLRPLYDALHDMIPQRKLEEFMEEGMVEIAPLAFMRGRTLDNACVILDEAQNTTTSQMKMFLTRMGKHAKFIVTGDVTQVDLPQNTKSGLINSMKILRKIDGISIINFDERDIIRHSLVKYISKAYDQALGKENNKKD